MVCIYSVLSISATIGSKRNCAFVCSLHEESSQHCRTQRTVRCRLGISGVRILSVGCAPLIIVKVRSLGAVFPTTGIRKHNDLRLVWGTGRAIHVSCKRVGSPVIEHGCIFACRKVIRHFMLFDTFQRWFGVRGIISLEIKINLDK